MPAPYRTFEVFVGDLANCGCDIIVNSSNTRVALGTGVSGRIRELCGGLDYQRSIHAALKREHPDGLLPPGKSLLTDAGAALQFKAIVHSAVVDYEQPMEPGAVNMVAATRPSIVQACAFSALAAAGDFVAGRELGAPSIGFPLMGSSVGKLTALASADAICGGCRKYFEWHVKQNGGQSAIRRVTLIAFRAEDADTARAALRKWHLVP